MSTRPIYLDHNASSPIDPRVLEAMADAARQGYANPASQHEPGRKARRRLEEARERIAQILGAQVTGMDADRVLFTSGATEANNLALHGLAGQPPGHILLSAVEHPSATGPVKQLAAQGFDVDTLPVDTNGCVTLDSVASRLTDATRCVSVMLANNETGALQTLEPIAHTCRDAGVPLHADAVQAAGRLAIDFQNLGVATLAISSHKLGGPCGVGALVIRHGVALEPMLHGGFQQGGLRPGTESVVLAIGLCRALEIWEEDRTTIAPRMAALRDRFEATLQAAWPDLVIHAHATDRLPQTSNLSFLGVDRQAAFMALDVAKIACSTGSACASGSTEPSHVLRAMGCRQAELDSALRFSLGPMTTVAELDAAAHRILGVLSHLKASGS